MEPLHVTDILAFDVNGAVLFHRRHQAFPPIEPFHQHAGAPIDESLGQPVMQCVRKFVLDLPGLGLPVQRIGKPAGAMRDKRPGAHVRDAV